MEDFGQMKEDLEELFSQEDEVKTSKKLWFFGKRALFFCILGIIGVYIYSFFFGDNSLGVLSKLKKQKSQIEDQVLSLQNENVELQKVIFELKGLEPNFEEKK